MHKTTGMHQKYSSKKSSNESLCSYKALLFSEVIPRIFVYEVKISFAAWNILLKAFYSEKCLILYTIQTPGFKFKRISECILRKPSSARNCVINSKAKG